MFAEALYREMDSMCNDFVDQVFLLLLVCLFAQILSDSIIWAYIHPLAKVFVAVYIIELV